MKKTVLAVAALILLGSLSLAYGFPAVDVYKKTADSVVLIVSGERGSGSLVGAGSIVTDDGLVVTNAHVVINKRTRAPYRKLKVFLKPGEVTGNLSRDLVNRHDARVVAYDMELDIAVLRVEDLPRDVRTISLADPREIMVGEEVVAIGHPEQGGLWTLTYGRISGQIKDQNGISGKDVYQTDTSVNRGNSGGPLLDRRGYLVGVNTNIARKGAGDLAITGVNFALKASVVKNWLVGKGYYLAYGRGASEAAPEASPVSKAEPVPEETKPSPAEKPHAKEPEPAKEREPAEEPELAEKTEPSKDGPDKGPAGSIEEELKSDTILTPKKPYTFNALFDEVEKEMEDMMDEMRRKIRR